MKIHSAQFIISAVSEKQYPKDQNPEIALAGRSNVGKSSLINRLIDRRNLVHTSSKPGKTRMLNFFHINESFYFVDVPGYGYAKVSKKERARWGEMMEQYFETREQLRGIILVVDLRHPPTKEDLQMRQYIMHLGLPLIVVGTKLDKIKKSKQSANIQQMKTDLQLDEYTPFIPFSALSGENKSVIWDEIKKVLS